MKVIERSLQEIGQSLLVTLPKSWTKTLNLKKGSPIKMTISEAGNLLIAPEFVKKEEKKETTIPFDDFFSKRFFSAYFEGNEKITITFDKEARIH
ncbi:AbrB/MazE/SpoVT family DNA-binding domain-containing protein [Candidatus Woesearchaeota archaeon]|nr:AbrB/MazE/SpoVT family DNA-binding domain-containing protein [Candidatus Woesearchaeota archaeon]